MNNIVFPSLQHAGLTLILGLGETGMAATTWCLRHGVALRVADTRSAPEGLDTLRELAAGSLDARLGASALDTATLDGVGRIVLSPGLCPTEAPLAEFLAHAHQLHIEIVGEIELFALALADMAEHGYRPRLLAVTGTNGKTTVTALARRLAQACGHRAVAAGNISPPALTALMSALDEDALPDVWVLELSSFQLESTYSLAPDAAVVLNISQDHLDWHGTMQAYAASKARLFKDAAIAVVNRDDPVVLEMVAGLHELNVRSFGSGVPEYQGDLGLEDSHGVEWLCSVPMLESEPARTSGRRKDKTPETRPTGQVQRLMPTEALKLRGRHNALNALAAMALVQAIDGGVAAMLHSLREYAGEPHRCEFLRNIGGIDFVNDSKGTNVGATVAALEGMGRPVVLIAGGLGKGQDFGPLAQAIARHAKGLVLIGQDAPLIRAALGEAELPTAEADSMEGAVQAAMQLCEATGSKLVLLSPACASMDMFRNYGERGRRFGEAVEELALDRGEVA